MIDDIKSLMPKKETLRRYYPDSPLADEELLNLADFVREQQKGQGVSPENKCLRMLIKWEEKKRREDI